MEAGHLHRAPGNDGVRRAYVCVCRRVCVACVKEEVDVESSSVQSVVMEDDEIQTLK